MTRKEWGTAPDVVLSQCSALTFFSFLFFLLFLPGPTLTSFFMHNWNTNDYPISIHSQALSPLPSVSLLPMRSHLFSFLSFFTFCISISTHLQLPRWKALKRLTLNLCAHIHKYKDIFTYSYTPMCWGLCSFLLKYFHMECKGERLKGRHSMEEIFSCLLLPRSKCVIVWLLHSEVNTRVHARMNGWIKTHRAVLINSGLWNWEQIMWLPADLLREQF